MRRDGADRRLTIADTREYQTVILAGLLHDIGKLLQRGESVQGLEISGHHPEVSASFVRAFSDVFAQVADPELLQVLVQRHHENPRLPSDLLVQALPAGRTRNLAALVSLADNLSSAERQAAATEHQYYKTTPLMCVLERLNHESDEGLSLRFLPQRLAAVGDDAFEGIFPAAFKEYSSGELQEHLKEFGGKLNTLFTPRCPAASREWWSRSERT